VYPLLYSRVREEGQGMREGAGGSGERKGTRAAMAMAAPKSRAPAGVGPRNDPCGIRAGP
jgi:hypothetical protein